METSLEERKIEIEEETLDHLNITRKWTMFLAIIGFIFLGLFIVMGVLAGTFLASVAGAIGAIVAFLFGKRRHKAVTAT